MTLKKKLQIFVSSTYSDLMKERQAAVQAILTAGHIPAGMELFAAADQSQMEVIKRWIDESDVFFLLLGGRYGSIDPVTKKSYVQLEYEYAQEKGKPFFAALIDEDYSQKRVKSRGLEVYETDNPQQLKDFRKTLLTKLVKFWRDPKDIELAVLRTLSEFARRDDLVGWIPADQAVNTGALAEEIARLAKENASLREQISKRGTESPFVSGVTFDEMFQLLVRHRIDPTQVSAETLEVLKNVAKAFQHSEPALLHFYWLCRAALKERSSVCRKSPESHYYLKELRAYKLLNEHVTPGGVDISSHVCTEYTLSEEGRSFLFRLMLIPGGQEADEYQFPRKMALNRELRAIDLRQDAFLGSVIATEELGGSDWKDFPDAFQTLKHCATHPSAWASRITAIHALGSVWKEHPETLVILKALAKSQIEEVRLAAVQELRSGWKKDPDVRKLLDHPVKSR